MRISSLLFGLAASSLMASPVLVSQAIADDAATCEKASGDIAIAACTRAINSGRFRGRNLAFLYNNRCVEYNHKGEHDRAIADCTEAIRFDPKDAKSYSNRGDAWRAKGDIDRAIADYTEAIRADAKDSCIPCAYLKRGGAWMAKGDNDRAIADYSEAIRLKPKDATKYRSRGYMYFDIGNFGAAAADLSRAGDIAVDAYTMLMRFVVRGRMGQDGLTELGVSAKQLKTKDWPYPVIDFYLGRRTVADVRAAAQTLGQKCEANFYIGEWHVSRGNVEDARALLQTAAATCPATFDEYDAATAELKRLKP